MVYLRFITEFNNEWNETKTGVFQALGFLIRSNDIFDYDKFFLNEVRNWFNKELKRPKKFNKLSNKNKNKNKTNIAISWYKSTSNEHINKMYDLIPIFSNYGIQVEVIKSENPGYLVYEDEFQIVTIPHGKDKSKVL